MVEDCKGSLHANGAYPRYAVNSSPIASACYSVKTWPFCKWKRGGYVFFFRLLKVCVSKVKLLFLADGTIENSENFWKRTKCSAWRWHFKASINTEIQFWTMQLGVRYPLTFSMHWNQNKIPPSKLIHFHVPYASVYSFLLNWWMDALETITQVKLLGSPPYIEFIMPSRQPSFP